MSREIDTTKTNRVILEDNTEYLYSIKPFELRNTLGAIIAVLQEFTFSKIGANDRSCYKLYKTREGNWYDIGDLKSSVDYSVLRRLKAAMDNLKSGV